MSFTFTLTLMLLGSSVVIAFVLQQPADHDPVTSALSPHRCRGESLESIRKSLLRALNLRAEPQLPPGSLDAVREQWQSIVSRWAKVTTAAAHPRVQAGSECCSVAVEVFMKDLGWDNWVIHPPSIAMVQCARCSAETNAVRCPAAPEAETQAACCGPTQQESVPVVYLDESSTVVMSSATVTSGCGCAPE